MALGDPLIEGDLVVAHGLGAFLVVHSISVNFIPVRQSAVAGIPDVLIAANAGVVDEPVVVATDVVVFIVTQCQERIKVVPVFRRVAAKVAL